MKQILGKQQKLSDFVCRKNEYSCQTMYWAQALASFVNNGAFLIVLGSCMFFAVAGRITIGEIVAITNMSEFRFDAVQGYFQRNDPAKSDGEGDG